jgi:hypothetical protein
LRTGHLLKCFNIDKYSGKTLTREEIIEIASQNEKDAIDKNKLKYGIYLN